MSGFTGTIYAGATRVSTHTRCLSLRPPVSLRQVDGHHPGIQGRRFLCVLKNSSVTPLGWCSSGGPRDLAYYSGPGQRRHLTTGSACQYYSHSLLAPTYPLLPSLPATTHWLLPLLPLFSLSLLPPMLTPCSYSPSFAALPRRYASTISPTFASRSSPIAPRRPRTHRHPCDDWRQRTCGSNKIHVTGCRQRRLAGMWWWIRRKQGRKYRKERRMNRWMDGWRERRNIEGMEKERRKEVRRKNKGLRRRGKPLETNV